LLTFTLEGIRYEAFVVTAVDKIFQGNLLLKSQ